MPDIEALYRLFDLRFREKANLTYSTIDASMKATLFERKKQLAEEYVRSKFGMSHTDFLATGKDKLPPDLFRDAILKIGAIELNAELIVCGFITDEPEIHYTDRGGRDHVANDFAVVGEGEYIASSVLLRRQQNSWTSLENTIYNLYEAKKYSEAVGSVGQNTVITILTPEGTDYETSKNVDNQLVDLFKKYGPSPLPDELKFTGKYYFDHATKTDR